MTTSTAGYHTEFNLTRPLANEFLAMSLPLLIEDRNSISELLSEPWAKAVDMSFLKWYLGKVVDEIERRRERFKNHRDDQFPPVWPDETDFDGWRAQAEAVKDQLSIERYLVDQVPTIEFRQVGQRLKAQCPFPDHPEKTPSFTIFEDGGAWCFGCNRGGDLFRIIGLVDGLLRFRDQLHRALEFVPEAGSIGHEIRSLTAPTIKGTVNCERSGRGGAFQPIKIVNGKVAS
jgi:hypothetical protein